jgi:hypothetical protein
MRLADVDCEKKCPGEDTHRLLVESSRLAVEAKHLKAWTLILTNEAKHHNVEAPGRIASLKVTQGISPA